MKSNVKQLESLSSEFVSFILDQLTKAGINIKEDAVVKDLAVLLRLNSALIKRQFLILDPIHSDMALLFRTPHCVWRHECQVDLPYKSRYIIMPIFNRV